MKINDTQRVGGINPYRRNQDSKSLRTDKKDLGKDQIQISSEAKELLEANVAQSTSQAEKVQQLKQSVATGTYHVEAGKIAEKLLPYLK